MRLGAADYSDAQVARMLIRELWRMYDSGGISMGRTLKAGLLEAAMHLLPPAEYDLAGITGEVVERVARRQKKEMPVQPMLLPAIEALPDKHLIGLLFVKLHNLVYGDPESSQVEYRLIVAICTLLNADDYVGVAPVTYQSIDLVEEARRRFSARQGV